MSENNAVGRNANTDYLQAKYGKYIDMGGDVGRAALNVAGENLTQDYRQLVS